MAAPRPVLIFAGGLGEARDFVATEGLRPNEWVFVRDPDQARYLPARSVAVLPGFERNPRYGLLAPLCDLLLEEHGPHVPRDATLTGRTAR